MKPADREAFLTVLEALRDGETVAIKTTHAHEEFTAALIELGATPAELERLTIESIDEAARAAAARAMPPKDWGFVNANTQRALTAIDELRAKTKGAADLERLRLIKLALFDLDLLQSELHELLFGLHDEGRFGTPRGRDFASRVSRRRVALEAARSQMAQSTRPAHDPNAIRLKGGT